VVWACFLLRPYLAGHEFLIRTDHASLRWPPHMDGAQGSVARWRLQLSEFKYKVCTRPGREHHCADAMSRLVTTAPDRSVIPMDIPCLALADSARGWVAPNYAEPDKDQPITVAAMLAAQQADARCQEIRELMDHNKQSRFSENEAGLLIRIVPLDRAVHVYVPQAIRETLLHLELNVVHAGHPGVNRMYSAMRRNYYWESMAAEVYAWVSSCSSCLRNRLVPKRRTTLPKLFPATKPIASVSMDLLGPLTTTKTGSVFLLIIVDRFTKLVRAIPMTSISATDVASAFCRDWISVHGPPDTALSDNGPQFASLFFQGVCSLMGIKNLYTTTYHPQTNGQVERFNKTLVDMFAHYIEDHQDNWDELVAVLALAYNSRPHRTTGIAPLDFVTPRRLTNFSLERIPVGLLPEQGDSPVEARSRFLEALKELIPQVRASIAKTQARYKRDYDKKVRPRRVPVKSGDYVYLRNHQRKHKLGPKATGPYEVLETDGRTFLLDQYGIPYRVSADHVVPAGPIPVGERPSVPKLAVPEALREEGTEFVYEHFLGHSWDDDGVLWLKVSWFGYNEEEDTWQHSKRLPAADVYKYCRRKGLLPQDPDKAVQASDTEEEA